MILSKNNDNNINIENENDGENQEIIQFEERSGGVNIISVEDSYIEDREENYLNEI